MEELKLEKAKLKETIAAYHEVIKYYDERLESISNMDNPRIRMKFMEMFNNKLKLIKNSLTKPYFARIDFKYQDSGKLEQCYIGKVGVTDEDNNIITVDWRAPIASLYYDSHVGLASYESPGGIFSGELLIKRLFNIEKGILESYQDVDTVANDEMLKPYLGTNADKRLKNIVSTIQSEQNSIIRAKNNNNIIVQGVAGSGKTTVALHRMAYLVYNHIDKIDPEQYLVIGPNKFFVDYISNVLPDLDVNGVNQLTYAGLAELYLGKEFILLDDESKLIDSIKNPDSLYWENLKGIITYQKAIDDYLNNLTDNLIPKQDFAIAGYTILEHEVVRDIFNNINNEAFSKDIINIKIKRMQAMILRHIDNNADKILSWLREQYHHKIQGLNDHELTEERNRYFSAQDELKNGCKQTFKKYAPKLGDNVFKIYIDFLQSLVNVFNIDNTEMISRNNVNIINLRKKIVAFEDLAPLIYLKYRINGPEEFIKINHVVIDEAQDLSNFNFMVLKKLMPNAVFSIFGDLAQSIYQYRSIDNWQEVVENIFDGDCEQHKLLKSYRTTAEIMNEANKVIEHIGMTPAEPVIRHGNPVQYIKYSDNQIDAIMHQLNHYLAQGHSSIAIICKDESESSLIHDNLKSKDYHIHNVNFTTGKYQGGICTISSWLAKGLEFDAVIIANASEVEYNAMSPIDMKLLYVSMTRALHELTILYSGTVVTPLQK